MKHPIKFQFEAEYPSPEPDEQTQIPPTYYVASRDEVERLKALEARYRESEIACDLGRELVAQMAREAGFWAYIGGHHVGIHNAADEPRLAIITATSPDWL